MIEKVLWVAAGSAAGGVLRFAVGAGLNRGGAVFPLGTAAVNLAGCFLIGFLAALAEGRSGLPESARLFLMAGFCGGFTTFSAFMYENALLADAGKGEILSLNIGVSLFAGYIFLHWGRKIGKIFFV